MTLKPYTATYYTSGHNYLNSNWDFSSYPASPGYPTGWSAQSGATPTQAAGGGVTIVGGAGAAASIACAIGAIAGPGWYVVEYILTLNSGALTGAGAVFNTFTDGGYGTSVEAPAVMADINADVSGTINGVGTVGNTYHFRQIVQIKDPTSLYAQLFIGAHFASESETNANQVTFILAGVRPATIGEIAAGNQVQSIAVFPPLPGTSPEIKKAPTFSTGMATSASGVERRTSYWIYPRWTFEIKMDVVRAKNNADEIWGLWELFCSCRGKRYPFLFLDQTDYTVSGEQFATGDGSTTLFQLTRAVRSWTEPVLCPFGVTVYVNGVATSVSLNSSGVVQFTSAPANGAVLTWSGYFFYPCRFEQDDLTMTGIIKQLWSNDGLKFISVKNLT